MYLIGCFYSDQMNVAAEMCAPIITDQKKYSTSILRIQMTQKSL